MSIFFESGFKFDSTYTQLPGLFYEKVCPVKVQNPELIVLNQALGLNLGLDFSNLSEKDLATLFSGNILPENAIAQAYAGHQFGHFTLLGDGRAVLLGEHLTPDLQRVDIQLKGSGPTPYSRRGDGRAALEPMLREYLISEAMYYLKVPTTRSLAVVKTGESVFRESVLPGAVLTRVATSHLRFGTFQFAALHQHHHLIPPLIRYTIHRHYPDLIGLSNPAMGLLKAVVRAYASLIVEWMRVGFIHGVMNTDNMSLSVETLDYGPCAFMDEYHPDTVFSAIDHFGRYAYGQQPEIAKWNLARFAESLLLELHPDQHQAIEMAEDAVEGFSILYDNQWLAMMKGKLGLLGDFQEDRTLTSSLLDWMQKKGADFTNTFFNLSYAPCHLPHEDSTFQHWYQRWQERTQHQDKSAMTGLMRSMNPSVIPRNHQVHKVLQAASKGDLTLFHDLLKVLQTPYSEGATLYQDPPLPHEKISHTFCGT